MIGRRDLARAALYHRLGAAERAGIPIATSIGRAIDAGGAGRALEPVQEALKAGEDLAGAVAAAPDLSPLERNLIAVGARGGKLPEVFEALAAHLEDRVKALRGVVGGLAYPVFLMHAAVVLPSAALLVTQGVLGFLEATLVPIAAAWAVVVAVVLLARAARRSGADAVDGALLRLPLVGAIVRGQSLALALSALRLAVHSGVPLLEGLALAAAATPNRAVAAVLERARRRMLDEGLGLGGAIAFERDLPPDVVDLLTTGEQTGQLDTMLGRAAERVADEARTARTVAIAGLGGLAFLLAAGLIAYRVIGFWSNIYGKALDGF